MRNCGTDMGTGELRDELKALGHKFDAHSDTEVLLRAYAELGERMCYRMLLSEAQMVSQGIYTL